MAGDQLTAVGGKRVRDIIDYYFYVGTGYPVLTIRRGEKEFRVSLPAGERPGLSFAAPFGRIRRCTNRCLFCFVDQQPPELRASLYFKDDDYRLSFWEGNFVTLTNCTSRDLERIVAQRLSPLYVSVHSTNPQLRARLMGNPRAAQINTQLAVLAAGGITLHTQVVLCPGLNDGAELERTVRDLASLFPAVRSVAVVPVGLTAYRAGLYPLRPVTPVVAAAVLEAVTAWQREFRRRYGSRIVFAADEFYLLAGERAPAARDYEGFVQIENGVGLVRRFCDSWKRVERRLPPQTKPLHAMVVTGKLAASLLRPVVTRLNAVAGLKVELLSVTNHFFGESVTVAGLLTGQDIGTALLAAFRERTRPQLVVVPAVALREGRVFLDEMTCAELAARVGCPVVAAATPRELTEVLGIKLTRRNA